MKNWLIFILLISIIVPTSAQEPGDDMQRIPWRRFSQGRFDNRKPAFSPWEYMKKEDEFITDKAKLTVIEANSVCPLLHKMKDEQRRLDFQVHHLLDQASNESLSEDASETLLKRIKELNAQKLTIENNYHRQMLKFISAKKLLQLLQADMKFDRIMLHKMFMGTHGGPNPCEKKD
ncbi:MAG: hypothetical protein PHU66_09065 [Bacteroidaceae bacterium]|nr:hypothetical protein [Bacteroidaceae bacterium]